ncbi:hypothetical protein [Laspinema olomoucense]|nr:hypothetical protein [Laspinema sp. D3d]
MTVCVLAIGRVQFQISLTSESLGDAIAGWTNPISLSSDSLG